jgi:hypothetical protein
MFLKEQMGNELFVEYRGIFSVASIPLALWLCNVFYRYIELPSHNLARRIFKTIPTFDAVIKHKH